MVDYDLLLVMKQVDYSAEYLAKKKETRTSEQFWHTYWMRKVFGRSW